MRTTTRNRLRTADPAAGLPSQPDERAERDLARLIAQSTSAPAARPEMERSRRLVPVIVTAVVAVLVLAVTVGTIATVRPRIDAGGISPAPTTAPTLGAGPCHPAEILPFACGTYRSDYGGSAVTGATGGPKTDPLDLSVVRQGGALLMQALGHRCLRASIPIRIAGAREVRFGEPTFAARGRCEGPVGDAWAAAFLRGSLRVDASVDRLIFNTGSRQVNFHYLGPAGLGSKQPVATPGHCTPTRVVPLTCGTYLSTEGSGRLGFLATDRFTMSVYADRSVLLQLHGRCNFQSVVVQFDGNTLVATPQVNGTVGCTRSAGNENDLVYGYFDGVVAFRVDGDTVTFTKGSDRVVFTQRQDDGCVAAHIRPFSCDTYLSVRGTGSLASLAPGSVPIRFTGGTAIVARVTGRCGVQDIEVDASSDSAVLVARGSPEHDSCPSGASDRALFSLLDGPVRLRVDGDTITFTKGGSSATFRR